MNNDDKHRLTIRLPQSIKESLQSMSKHTGLPMTELVVSGTLLLLGHEEAMRVYENRIDDFLDKASEQLDHLLTEHKAAVNVLMDGMADIIEADRAVFDNFILQLKALNTTNTSRPPSGGSTSRVGPTGAPILG